MKTFIVINSNLRSMNRNMYIKVTNDELADYYNNPHNNKTSCFSLFDLFNCCYKLEKPKLVRQYNLIPHPIYYIKNDILEPFGNNDYIDAAVPYNWIPVFENKKIVWYARKEELNLA